MARDSRVFRRHLRNGAIRFTSVAHGANNLTEHMWQRLAVPVESASKPPLGADVV
jgi:hypothetical protein